MTKLWVRHDTYMRLEQMADAYEMDMDALLREVLNEMEAGL